MHISQPASLDREALELNRASEDSLPMTFVDEAELLRRRLDGGSTQQALADEMGWSREKVKNYSALSKICKEAWEIVGTTISELVTVRELGDVPSNGTGVPFTENLLRSIIQLEPAQQLELVHDLRDGKITKGKFASQAEAYRARNEARDWFLTQAGGLDEDLIDEGVAGIGRGLYDAEWRGGKGPGPKLTKLLESSRRRQSSAVLTRPCQIAQFGISALKLVEQRRRDFEHTADINVNGLSPLLLISRFHHRPRLIIGGVSPGLLGQPGRMATLVINPAEVTLFPLLKMPLALFIATRPCELLTVRRHVRLPPEFFLLHSRPLADGYPGARITARLRREHGSAVAI